MDWTLREFANYQIGFNQRLEGEQKLLVHVARNTAYLIAAYSGNMKKGMTPRQFWRLDGEDSTNKIKEMLELAKKDPRFPKKI